MSTVMERYIGLVKQYPGQEQVDLAVEIEVPGSLFGVGLMGSLTTTERQHQTIKKKNTVSALELHCAVSTKHSKCTQHSVHNKS